MGKISQIGVKLENLWVGIFYLKEKNSFSANLAFFALF